MNCQQSKKKAAAFVGNTLADHEREAVQLHLQQCPACRQYFETMQAMLAPPPVQRAPAGFAFGVMRKLNEKPTAPVPLQAWLLHWLRPATYALLLAAGVWLGRWLGTPATSSSIAQAATEEELTLADYLRSDAPTSLAGAYFTALEEVEDE